MKKFPTKKATLFFFIRLSTAAVAGNSPVVRVSKVAGRIHYTRYAENDGRRRPRQLSPAADIWSRPVRTISCASSRHLCDTVRTMVFLLLSIIVNFFSLTRTARAMCVRVKLRGKRTRSAPSFSPPHHHPDDVQKARDTPSPFTV